MRRGRVAPSQLARFAIYARVSCYYRGNSAPRLEGSQVPPTAPIFNGALAQLVEHLHGMQGVTVSNTVSSTERIRSGKVYLYPLHCRGNCVRGI